jgi:hypothetical protein
MRLTGKLSRKVSLTAKMPFFLQIFSPARKCFDNAKSVAYRSLFGTF